MVEELLNTQLGPEKLSKLEKGMHQFVNEK
jgi:hypothetical protein